MKYIKKPIQIEAMQLLGNEQSIRSVMEYMGHTITTDCDVSRDRFSDYCRSVCLTGLSVKTLESGEGVQIASIGDYIIKGIHGEFYPCKSDIFKLTYDKVED